MTASRTAYQNNYPSSSASVSADIHHSWHPQTHSSHTAVNGINGLNSVRSRPVQTPNGTTTANRIAHKKSDFYKNGRPAEVIVIDSESPAPPSQSLAKRKRENSVSTSTTVSAATKRARKSLNDENAMLSKSSAASVIHKAHTVSWSEDKRGVYRAREVAVPKVEEVIPLFSFPIRCPGRTRLFACILPNPWTMLTGYFQLPEGAPQSCDDAEGHYIVIDDSMLTNRCNLSPRNSLLITR